MKIDSTLKIKSDEAVAAVDDLLATQSPCDQACGKEIISRYVAAIEGNFIPWVAAAAVSARTVQGRYAAEENLQTELRENHQGMLRDFAIDTFAQPLKIHYEEVYYAVQRIRRTVGQMNGLQNIALLAYLENTSKAFIPFLENLAKTLGSRDLTYTQAHGVADIEHADQFLWALGHEMNAGYKKPEQTIDDVIRAGHDFLRTIFWVGK